MSTSPNHLRTGDVHTHRLFIGSCVSLIATSVAFAVVGAVMLALKREFVLTNEEVGWIGGAALWGFAVSQLIFAPLCDSLGFRFLLRLAFLGHLLGTVIMILAPGGFWGLFTGALVIALGNGLVEAACNPLVTALYPNDKTTKLNQFHVWFPGGIVIGGVAAFLLDQVGIGAWQVKLALILIPTVAYGFLMLRERFPATENVQAGISTGASFRAILTPLFLLMLFCMAITASTELGPNRWIPAVLEAGGIHGILVLVWISGLMAVLRYWAGPVVHRLSPTGILLLSSILSAIGLFWFSYAETTVMAFASATVFAVGVCYFWPTMLGFVAERIPRSGALGLGLMGAVGMAVVGLVTSPLMGRVADVNATDRMAPEQTVAVLQNVTTTFPALVSQAPAELSAEITRAVDASQGVLNAYQAEGALPEVVTANALRAIQESRTAVQTTGSTEALTAIDNAGAILGPADHYGGRMSFRYIVPFTCLLIFIFGALYLSDRRSGGYKVKHVSEGDLQQAQRTAKISA